jgi:hypothetical protein
LVINYPTLAADAGRIAANPDISAGQLKMALFSAPAGYQSSSEPTLYLAASTPIPGWRRQYVQISHADRTQLVQTARRKSILGYAATALGVPQNEAKGRTSVEIVLHDADQWLVSCDDRDLRLGDNLAVIGNEVIQFGEATPLGGGRFRLARLLRDRAGSGGAIGVHCEGEPFVLVEPGALQPVILPVWVPASPIRASTQNGSAECSLTLPGKTSACG